MCIPYPAPVPYQYPAPPPYCVYPYPASTIDSLMQFCIAQAVEHERWQNSLRKKDLAEQAYTSTQIVNDGIYTVNKAGMLKELLNQRIVHSFYIVSHPLLNHPAVYLIQMSNATTTMLTEEEYFRDAKLISRLQRLPGVKITTQRTQKTTAELLRQAIDSQMQNICVDYYAGWQAGNSGGFEFRTFPGFVTHCVPQLFPCTPQRTEQASDAVVALAAARFLPIFDVERKPFIRDMLVLSFHEASVHSLLTALGYEVPLVLCFFSEDMEQLTYIEQMFSWFGDAPLDLNILSKNLGFDLLSRKDEPVLVKDQGRLNHAEQNIQILSGAMINQEVTVKVNKSEESFPIQGPIMLLSSRASALTQAPETIVLDIPLGSFDRDAWIELEDRITDNHEYLIAFTSFIEEHVSDLQEALKRGRKIAQQQSHGELNQRCTDSLGIFVGIALFLKQFSRFCELPTSILVTRTETLIENLVDLMRQTTEKEELTSLDAQFISIARSYIATGALQPCAILYRQEPDKPETVYYDDDCLHFTTPAFCCVCEALAQSRPTVLQALTDAGLFRGRQINSTTAKTRISVWNEQGFRQNMSVYSIARTAFDELGDPLILEKEDF